MTVRTRSRASHAQQDDSHSHHLPSPSPARIRTRSQSRSRHIHADTCHNMSSTGSPDKAPSQSQSQFQSPMRYTESKSPSISTDTSPCSSPSCTPVVSPSRRARARSHRTHSHTNIRTGISAICDDDECVCPTALSSLCGSNQFTRYALLTYDALPCWLKDNRHVQSGYRVDMGWRRSCESLCHLHNETINVWSHLLGFCMVACLLIITLATMSPHGIDRIQLGAQMKNSSETCPVSGLAVPHTPPSALSPFQSLSFDFMSAAKHDDDSPSLFSRLDADSFTRLVSSMHAHFPSIEQVTADLREKAQDMMDVTGKTANSLISNTTRNAFLQYVQSVELQLGKVKQSVNELCTPNCSSLASSQWESVRTTFQQQVAGVQHMFQHLTEEGADTNLLKITQTMLHDFQTKLANIQEPGLAALSLVPISVLHGVEHIVMLQNLHSFLARWPLTVFLVSAMCCLLFSSIYHLFVSVSRRIATMLQCLDYAGINLLIAGSNVPVIYYGLFCSPYWAATYIIIACTLAIFGFSISILPQFRNYKYRGFKTAVFVGTGIWGAVPMTHMIIHLGHIHFIFYYMLVMGACYLVGAMIYLMQVPERWIPGKFDYFFHSHQLWHILVFVAVIVHYVGVMHMYEWRMHTTCTARGPGAAVSPTPFLA